MFFSSIYFIILCKQSYYVTRQSLLTSCSTTEKLKLRSYFWYYRYHIHSLY